MTLGSRQDMHSCDKVTVRVLGVDAAKEIVHEGKARRKCLFNHVCCRLILFHRCIFDSFCGPHHSFYFKG